jgi:bisphosphoglycerate-dependent phosphoglycerate mutase family 1
MDQHSRISIVFIRHGESQWNKENRFTGWTDVGLCESGVLEAQEAGRLLKSKNFDFDVVFTSILKRSVTTFNLIAEEMNLHHIPVVKSWRLNERHYGYCSQDILGHFKVSTRPRLRNSTARIKSKYGEEVTIPAPQLLKSLISDIQA